MSIPTKVLAAREWFVSATFVEYEEQTYRPELVGTRLAIRRAFATRTIWVDAEGKVFHGSIPTRAKDVLELTPDTIRFVIPHGPKGPITVGLRKVASA